MTLTWADIALFGICIALISFGVGAACAFASDDRRKSGTKGDEAQEVAGAVQSIADDLRAINEQLNPRQDRDERGRFVKRSQP